MQWHNVVIGQGTLCSKDLIFDIAGGHDYLQKVLGDSVETANSRQTEATNFFYGQFGKKRRVAAPQQRLAAFHKILLMFFYYFFFYNVMQRRNVATTA